MHSRHNQLLLYYRGINAHTHICATHAQLQRQFYLSTLFHLQLQLRPLSHGVCVWCKHLIGAIDYLCQRRWRWLYMRYISEYSAFRNLSANYCTHVRDSVQNVCLRPGLIRWWFFREISHFLRESIFFPPQPHRIHRH